MFPIKVYHKDEHDCGPNCNHEHDNKKESVEIIPAKVKKQITFPNFFNFFPALELPYSIVSDTQRLIALEHEILSPEWLFNFVLDEEATIDEFTEFMPCFSIPSDKGIFIIVYWEANLEGNSYHLVTFSKTGVLIDKLRIAGTKYEASSLIQSVCTISEYWMVSIVDARIDENGNAIDFSHETHQQRYFQVSMEGEIIKY